MASESFTEKKEGKNTRPYKSRGRRNKNTTLVYVLVYIIIQNFYSEAIRKSWLILSALWMYSGTFLIVCYFFFFFHLVLLATRAFCVLTSPRRSIYSIDASTQQTFSTFPLPPLSLSLSLLRGSFQPLATFSLPKQNTPRIFLILFLYLCPEDGTCVIRQPLLTQPAPPPTLLHPEVNAPP